MNELFDLLVRAVGFRLVEVVDGELIVEIMVEDVNDTVSIWERGIPLEDVRDCLQEGLNATRKQG